MTTFLATIGAIVLVMPAFIGLMLLSSMWRAWWLYPAWSWFIVPLGIPQISFWHFMALMLLISVCTAHPETKKDERKIDWAVTTIVFFAPVITWVMLWWIHRG